MIANPYFATQIAACFYSTAILKITSSLGVNMAKVVKGVASRLTPLNLYEKM
jgi:hypothetical protein|tara:strand:- start:484 stop:639 length:156 start_codon:yes stop_codon:yes gene_type:complete